MAWNNICYKLYQGQCLVVKNLPINAGDLREWVRSLDQGDLLEEELARQFQRIFFPGESHEQRSLVDYSP